MFLEDHSELRLQKVKEINVFIVVSLSSVTADEQREGRLT